MNAETNHPKSSVSTEETHSSSLPLFLTSSSSSLKPLRARNRTNLKRRIKLSRSQVLSADFENDDDIHVTNVNTKLTTVTATTSSQPPTLHSHSDLYSKAASPKTPSPIHTTVTCSQVWERLASNEEPQTSTSPKTVATSTSSTTSLPTHISFSFDPSDNEDDGEEIPLDDRDDFQYVPLSSQSKLVQFQFLTFAKQQKLDSDTDNDEGGGAIVVETAKPSTTIGRYISEDEDDDEDNDHFNENHHDFTDHENENQPQEHEGEEQPLNRMSKKRKRSISTSRSIDSVAVLSTANENIDASASVTKPPRTKKPRTKDPNANFQRLNMRKKQFSHAKKHQFAKHKRNAFYRRTRHAGTYK